MNDRTVLGLCAAGVLAACLACGGGKKKEDGERPAASAEQAAQSGGPASAQSAPMEPDAQRKADRMRQFEAITGKKGKPDFLMPVTELISEYKGNEVRADAKFKGKDIVSFGKVGDVKKDLLGSIYVTIGAGAQFELQQVQAFFDDKFANRAATLNKGDDVAVRCDCDGLMMNVLMRHCTFVDIDALNAWAKEGQDADKAAAKASAAAAAPSAPPRGAKGAKGKTRH